MKRSTVARLGLLYTLAGCGAPAAPPPAATTPPAARSSAATTVPAPSVQWRDGELATAGLPAIARDGRAIVLAHRDNDGGRGNPNLTLLEKDRGDRVIARQVVWTAQELAELPPDALAHRIEAANAWLRERHVARALVPMTPLVSERPTADEPTPAIGGGVQLRWSANELVLAGERGTLVRRTTPASWLAADRPLCASCTEVCHNEAFLQGGHVDLQRTALIVMIGYLGTDTCWEPSSQQHVVVW